MIKFHEDNLYKHVMFASYLAVDDFFFIAEFYKFGGGLKSVTPYTVKKILKRDVVCESDTGKELRFPIKSNVCNCYLPNSEDLNNLLKEEETRKRRLKCIRFLEDHPLKHHIDDEFMNAIEAYEARVNAKKESEEEEA